MDEDKYSQIPTITDAVTHIFDKDGNEIEVKKTNDANDSESHE